MFGSHKNQDSPKAEEAKRASAKAILEMGDSEGWKCFVKTAEALITTYMPDVTTFTAEESTQIASKMAFVSGIKRCLKIMEHQRDILGQKPTD